MHADRALAKLASLPPMVMVTKRVSVVSSAICGVGLGELSLSDPT